MLWFRLIEKSKGVSGVWNKCVMLKVWDKYVNWLKLVIINSWLKVEEVNLDFRSEQSE